MYIHPTFRWKTFRMKKAFQSWLKMDQEFNKIVCIRQSFKKICIFTFEINTLWYEQILLITLFSDFTSLYYSKVSKD